MGDFNAHNPSWLSTQDSDPRVVHLLDHLEEMTVLNEDAPNRLPFNPDMLPTSPDIAFASPDLSLEATWRVFGQLFSDHLLILVSLELSTNIQPRPKHTFLNYRKADRASFISCVEEGLSSFSLPSIPGIDSAVDELTRVTYQLAMFATIALLSLRRSGD